MIFNLDLLRLSLVLIQFTYVISAGTPKQLKLEDGGHPKRVAIIGAGAAGSSTAYYLRQDAAEAGISVDITVFERSGYIGGRSTTVMAYGGTEAVELGASIFVDVNQILKNRSAEFGLRPKASETEGQELLGIWDGTQFVYMQQEAEGWRGYWNMAKLLWKYGLAPLRTQRLMKTTVGKFLKLYNAPFFPFRSLSSRAIDLDLVSTTAMTGEQLLASSNIGELFATDIIQASTRVNYGQNLRHINGLLTMVCMAIDGAMQIEGGNWLIFDGMIKASNATVHLNTSVTDITKHGGQYEIKTSSTAEARTSEDVFDTVVLAGPLQYSNINIENADLKHTPDKIPYVKLHVTLFTSPRTLNPVFFGLSPTDQCPDSILTTLQPADVPEDADYAAGKPGFFSISTLRTVINPQTLEQEYLYKIFSPKKVDSAFLSGILGAPIAEDLTNFTATSGEAITWYYPHVWHSYPIEYPRVTFEEIELAKNFYYTSSVETFISCMETSALMGMNVARLVVDDFAKVLDEDMGESSIRMDHHLVPIHPYA